ncbi:MAG TPA: T9SS type A sorting domain-containing protein, partial [candidate division Zixibacteria bacterium]|nr:T9SS type A sorting domain-containing protein [candidate division Zixibacteria bacterium]
IYDAEIPPALPHTDFVSFVSDEGEPLSADIRSSFAGGVSRKQWRLRIDGLDLGEPVEIFWDRDHLPDEQDCSYGTNQIPEIYEIIFTNPATGENIDMREINSYRFTYTGPTEFVITVSTISLGIEKSKLPSTITVLSNTPNPFNSATEIRFALPEDARITIDIVDINGKVVRKLVNNAEFSAGWHSVIWNGCDNKGQLAPSGIYFCRIITEDAEISQKMLLVK